MTSATKLQIITLVEDFPCHHPSPIQGGLMKLFIDSKKSLSAPEILDHLKKKFPTLNKSTIYRRLDFLVEKELLTVLEIDGSKRYQLNENHPQGVLVCTKCKNIDFIKEKITFPNLESVTTKNNFQIKHHSLIILGLCSKCQKIK